MADPKFVTLVDPNGQDHKAFTPVELSSLVFGAGYKVKEKGKTVDEAIASLSATPPQDAVAPPAGVDAKK